MSNQISIIETPNRNEENYDNQNERTIMTLYKALSRGDTEAVVRLMAADQDLDYWFHGPPKCEHMMRVLTGCVGAFQFEPRSVNAVGGSCVIAEGWEGAEAYWVHVWTVQDGVVTQLREYFNTWLTVRDLRPSGWGPAAVGRGGSGGGGGDQLWQSMPRDLFRRSLPGLLLAI